MNDNSATNYFLSSIYDLYEAVNIKDDDLENFVPTNTGLFKRKKYQSSNNIKERICYEKILDKCNYLKNNVLDFDKLFDFATFIRSIDKVFFYKNDTESIICCNTPMSEKRERTLIINIENITILINLMRGSALENPLGEYINIKIIRNYGKKLINEFKIINRETAFNDSDDLMLMNVVNKLLSNIVSDFYKEYATAIYEDRLIDVSNYKFFNPSINNIGE